MKLNPYFTFDGTCSDAMTFYQSVLGGEVELMLPFSEMPEDAQEGFGGIPEGMESKIMHATFRVGDVVIMGADAVGPYPKPQGVHVSLGIDDVNEAERVYSALSEGGEIQMPLGETFWAERFGMFADRFGVQWMINCEKPMD